MANYSDAAAMLKEGKIGVLPTDTVYGLVCIAENQSSVKRLYELKKREQKPGTIIAANIEQLVALGIKARYLKAVEHYWPNPISIVIPNHELSYVHQGVGSIAVRIPSDNNLHNLLLKTGPLVTSSANQPGMPEAVNVGQAERYFKGAVDFYVDGGDLSSRKPSTIIRVVDDAVEIIRQGAVTVKENGELEI